MEPQEVLGAIEISRCASQRPVCLLFCGMFPPNKVEKRLALPPPSLRIQLELFWAPTRLFARARTHTRTPCSQETGGSYLL